MKLRNGLNELILANKKKTENIIYVHFVQNHPSFFENDFLV